MHHQTRVSDVMCRLDFKTNLHMELNVLGFLSFSVGDILSISGRFLRQIFYKTFEKFSRNFAA